MAKYICLVCGYVYDETDGAWDDLPEDWTCPVCSADRSEFKKEEDSSVKVQATGLRSENKTQAGTDTQSFSSLEKSALCANLARGNEKQYRKEDTTDYKILSDYFKKRADVADNPNFEELSLLLENDLAVEYPKAHTIASDANDRGALRALIWTEKVSKILKSLLNRYNREGKDFAENNIVSVCSICGFIYIGDNLPDVCPVCKVPNWKFEIVKAG